MPELQLPYVEPLTFFQRLVNTLLYSIQVPHCVSSILCPALRTTTPSAGTDRGWQATVVRSGEKR